MAALVVAVLAGALAIAPGPAIAASAATTFPDVPATHPFATEIGWLAGTGITGGYEDGTFRPTAPISRQAFGAFLYRYDQATVAGGTSPFTDVTAAHPFVDEILWLADNGIANGYPDGTFRPTAPITRQALAGFLYRANGTPDAALDPIPPDTPFSDVDASHPFAREIAWLARRGIATGFPDGTFHPAAPVSRQSLAAFLYRMAGSPAPGAPGRNRADPAQVRIIDVASVVTATAGAGGTTVTLGATDALPAVNQLVVIDAGGATPDGLIGRVGSVDAGLHRFVAARAAVNEVYASGAVDVTRVVDGPSVDALTQQAGLTPSMFDACTGVDMSVTPAFRVLVRLRASWEPGQQPTMLIELQARATAAGRFTTAGSSCDQTVTLPIGAVALRAFVLGLAPVRGAIDFLGTLQISNGAVALAGDVTTTHTLRFALADGHGAWSVGGGGALTNWNPVPFDHPWHDGAASLALGPHLAMSWFGALGMDARVDTVIGASVTSNPYIGVTTTRGSRVTGAARPDSWFLGQVPSTTELTATDAKRDYLRPQVDAPLGFPPLVIGQPYDVTLAGGIHFSIVAGALPPGLTLDDVGHISGTPPTDAPSGTYVFTVAAHNDLGLEGTAGFMLAITRPNIRHRALVDAQVGQDTMYRQTLIASYGAPGGDLRWLQVAGTLPPGLTLSLNGELSGEPTTAGRYTFTVMVADVAGQYDEATFEVLVKPASAWFGTVTEQITSKRCTASGWESACYWFTFTSTVTLGVDGTQHVEYSDVNDSDTWWNGDGVTTPYCHMVAKFSVTSIGDDGDPADIIVTPGAAGTKVSVEVTLPVHDLVVYDTQAGYCGDPGGLDETLPRYAAAFPFDDYGRVGTGIPIDTAVTAPGDDYAGTVTNYFGDGQPYESVSSTYTWDLHRTSPGS